MRPFKRESALCSELMRSAQEILDYYAIPPLLRPRRVRTHEPKTVDEYVYHLGARFIPWCFREGRSPLPAAPETVLLYQRYLHEVLGLGVPTVLAQRKAIATWHVSMDLIPPDSRELWLYHRALSKEHTVAQATPASAEHVQAMCRLAALQPPIQAARDIALLLWSYMGAFRPGESRLARVEDLYESARGLRVIIPTSKYNRNKPREVTLTHTFNHLYCPICALARWREAGKITQGILFRGVLHERVGTDRRMGHSTINKIIRKYGRAVGLRGKVTAYTMRRGCATTATENGAALEDLRNHLRHQDPETTLLYIDQAPVPFERSLTALVMP